MKTITFPKRTDLFQVGEFTATLEWSREAQRRINDLLTRRTPEFIMNHVLETIEPYIFRDTADMIESAYRLTTIDADGITFRWQHRRPAAVNLFYNGIAKRNETGKRGKLWTLRYLNDGAGGLLKNMQSEFGFTTRGVLRAS